MKTGNQNTQKNQLSVTRINWIREQGYFDRTNQEITDLAFGNRFAFRLCTTLLIIGIAFANIPLLSIMMVIAFLGVILPHHPFDYIYNHLLRKQMNKPKLPTRSNQLKFACAMATLFIGTTIYLFYEGLMLWGYITGGSLVVVALLVSSIDFCIPSKIYNSLFSHSKTAESKA